MSRFKRKNVPTKTYDKPWENPEYDPLRPNKKKVPKPTEQEMFLGTCCIARKMILTFGWKPWMATFIDENGNNQPFHRRLMI